MYKVQLHLKFTNYLQTFNFHTVLVKNILKMIFEGLQINYYGILCTYFLFISTVADH